MSDEASKATVASPASEFLSIVVGAAVFASIWYYSVGLFDRIPWLNEGWIVWAARWTGPVLMSFVILGGLITQIEAARARRAARVVGASLDTLKSEGKLATMSVEELAKSVVGAGIGTDQLMRLVDQKKQQLLLDDVEFQLEVSDVLVTYLQPLPRNAKRLLNRVRVTRHIAHRRGLFTSDPAVSAAQIGKWVVLCERWPQLGRTLSTVPERIHDLEKHCATMPRGSAPDPFMDCVKSLAPFYVDDEALRAFLGSEPSLGASLQLLVHYDLEPHAHPQATP